ncbi:hypothetical protein GALMADRAFT_238610 [Galerina marginata CBS 339.88]|uniref:Uncharacterized protein n=1 Tax=Galerina marginata (strain CBS 339.88) TaxID=685588 RepID=A0A067TII8_GALM3|nr:hypothetical protein GALMADRAFT_238610 [Galerina marginata CBS 339.88]
MHCPKVSRSSFRSQVEVDETATSRVLVKSALSGFPPFRDNSNSRKLFTEVQEVLRSEIVEGALVWMRECGTSYTHRLRSESDKTNKYSRRCVLYGSKDSWYRFPPLHWTTSGSA